MNWHAQNEGLTDPLQPISDEEREEYCALIDQLADLSAKASGKATSAICWKAAYAISRLGALHDYDTALRTRVLTDASAN